jgi:hypothetical protein
MERETERPQLAQPALARVTECAAQMSVPEMSDVAYRVQPAPRYPPESRRTRKQGLVLLRVFKPFMDGGVARMDGGVARAAAAMVPWSSRCEPLHKSAI